jgi:hypothetical protein
MNPGEAFAIGIAPMHMPALVAAMLLPVVVFVVRRLRAPVIPTTPHAEATDVQPTPHNPGTVRMWAAWLLGIAAAVHLALPLGHYDGPLLTIAFVGSGAAYAWLAFRAYEGRTWRLWSALLLIATVIAYLVVSATGGEEPDQVGIATALVELVALGLCLVPSREEGRPRRFKRFAGSAATITFTFIVGTVIWISSFAAHAATDTNVSADPQAAGTAVSSGTTVGNGDDHTHAHEHAARAQAGVIMRPQGNHHPTVDQVAAAQALADATKVAMAKYAHLDDAIAAGFVLPKPGQGPDVHMEHKANRSDGRVLDPERPETLVYAISGGTATLLGVVFVMEKAGVAAPEPGGPITRWHAHNICLTLLPPGFGIVSPFGSCPALSINLTTPEMMHVWVVDNPGGAFAEGLDKEWVRAYHSEHGLPYGGR